MDARSAKASQSTLCKIYFQSAIFVILQDAPVVAAKDLILIKEAHEFFINSGTSDWVSSWSLNHGDTANPSAETRRRYRGVKEVDECLCPFVRRRHFYRQQSYFCHLLQVCIINWIIKVNWRLNPCSILLEFFSSDMNFPCTAKEREKID